MESSQAQVNLRTESNLPGLPLRSCWRSFLNFWCIFHNQKKR